MATLALSTLVYLLYICVPAVISSEPLIVTIAKDGSDEQACLSGKIPCKTFDYARGVDGKGGNVTLIITYPQELNYHATMSINIGHNISNATIVGQVGDDHTFIATTNDTVMRIYPDPLWGVSPRLLCFENIHSACPLVIHGIIQVQFKDYYNPRVLELFEISILTIEESTLAGVHLYFSTGLDQSTIMKINNSLFINNDTILDLKYIANDSRGPISQVEIFIEHTDFKFTPAPSPDQPPYMAISFDDVSIIDIFVSKCNFFNDNSTTLAIEMYDSNKNDVDISILDSHFYVSPYGFFGNMVTSQIGVWQASISTRLDGNKFYVSD